MKWKWWKKSASQVERDEEGYTLIPLKDKHIRQGKSGKMFECPITLAVREHLGLDTHAVWTGIKHVNILQGGKNVRYSMSVDTYDWRRAFDGHREVQPTIIRIKEVEYDR